MNLGVHFLYQVPLQIQNSFLDTVKNILQVLRFWNGRMLSLEGGIIILKYLLFLKIDRRTSKISKIVYMTHLVQKVVKKQYVTSLKMVAYNMLICFQKL